MRPLHRWRVVVLLLATGCAGSSTPASEPPTEGTAGAGGDRPDVDKFEYVSGEDDSDTEAAPEDPAPDEKAPAIDSTAAVTTADRVHELAEEAVADELNPRQQWRPSPVFPAKWPAKDDHVIVFFYPMAVHPDSTSLYELFSAAYVVTVALGDGSTKVTTIPKKRRLGTIEVTRPSLLERNEVAIAEQALVEAVLGRDGPVGESNFWGYLKFFHEHGKIARDLAKRAPAFIHWINRSGGRHKY